MLISTLLNYRFVLGYLEEKFDIGEYFTTSLSFSQNGLNVIRKNVGVLSMKLFSED